MWVPPPPPPRDHVVCVVCVCVRPHRCAELVHGRRTYNHTYTLVRTTLDARPCPPPRYRATPGPCGPRRHPHPDGPRQNPHSDLVPYLTFPTTPITRATPPPSQTLSLPTPPGCSGRRGVTYCGSGGGRGVSFTTSTKRRRRLSPHSVRLSLSLAVCLSTSLSVPSPTVPLLPSLLSLSFSSLGLYSGGRATVVSGVGPESEPEGADGGPADGASGRPGTRL